MLEHQRPLVQHARDSLNTKKSGLRCTHGEDDEIRMMYLQAKGCQRIASKQQVLLERCIVMDEPARRPNR